MKVEQLRFAFQGNFTQHHALLTRLHLDRIDGVDAQVTMLTEQINQHLEAAGIMWARDLLVTISGIKEMGADNILAEIGADMSAFPTPAQLTSWAGCVPVNTSQREK